METENVKTAIRDFPYNFSEALNFLKAGRKMTRVGWVDKVHIEAQYPDENSKMQLPYIFMVKKFPATSEVPEHTKNFPCDLSCESLFAEDWKIIS